MSLYNRRAVLLFPAALAACGFQPVYGPGGSGTKLQNNVEVVEPTALDGYLMTRRIEERLGRANTPAYTLSLNVTTSQQSLAVNSESNINRFNLVGVATFSLVEQSTGSTLVSGSVNNFTGSSASGTTAETLAASRDARRRLMTLLADQVVERLLTTDLA